MTATVQPCGRESCRRRRVPSPHRAGATSSRLNPPFESRPGRHSSVSGDGAPSLTTWRNTWQQSLTALILLLATSSAMAQSADDVARHDAQQVELIQTVEAGRLADAESLGRRLLAEGEQLYGPGHRKTATDVINLATVLSSLNRIDEAEILFRRALAILEATLPPDHPDIGTLLGNLGATLTRVGRLEEAEQPLRRSLQIAEARRPANDSDVAMALNNLAEALSALNRLDEAEQLHRRALAILDATLPAMHHNRAGALSNLGLVAWRNGKPDEAIKLMRDALAIFEQVLPANHPTLALALSNLAELLRGDGRSAEAERLLQRALAIYEAVLPPDHPDIASCLGNLSLALFDLGRAAEAEAYSSRTLEIYERILPADHPSIALTLNNRAAMLNVLGKPEEAEPLMRRAIAISERTKPGHPSLALNLSNYVRTLLRLDRYEEAIPFSRRAVEISQQSLPPNHLQIADVLINEAYLTANSGRPAEALDLYDQVAAIRTARQNRSGVLRFDWRGLANIRLESAYALMRSGGDKADARAWEARRAALVDLQWSSAPTAGAALAAATARAQAGDTEIGRLARQRDGAIAQVRQLDEAFVALSSADSLDSTERRSRLQELRAAGAGARARLDEIEKEITARFPRYAELADGLPATIAEIHPLLAEDEVLVSVTPHASGGFFFAVTRERELYSPLPRAADAAFLAARLRCAAAGALDSGCAAYAAGTPEIAAADPARGAVALTGAAPTGVYDLALAHDLYDRLFPESVRKFVGGRKLIIAPAPELIGLPWHLLTTEPPPQGWDAPGADRAAIYRQAAWLFTRHPSISVVPSISSLRALREAKAKQMAGDLAYLGVGDPTIGRTAAERDAPPPPCRPMEQQVAGVDGSAEVIARAVDVAPADVFLGATAAGFALADPEQVRTQPRLADTRCEIEAIATALEVRSETADRLLGDEATEPAVKSLDRDGTLARYRLLHFATHGLVGGELGSGEPGLLMTPPAVASVEDDGVLTSSEIAALNIGAEWVILSACNTAAGTVAGSEALSGLARSFFYSGARSLLVSSWPVYSPAAVDITTRAFAAMDSDPTLGRGEALAIAMRGMLASAGTERTAHPSWWAPFFLVGEPG
jgi:tetratricopeptide (TPR) repeat protein